MTLRDDITVLILTYNEEDNIERTLRAVQWANRIVIVDSGSTDDTLKIAAQFPQARVVVRPFDSHQAQSAFGLAACGPEAAWVLALDADFCLTPELSQELSDLRPSPAVAGYRARFRYAVHGRLLRGSLYPPRTVLFRADRAKFIQEGHAHRAVVDGGIDQLQGHIVHDDRKPLSRWLASQRTYARLEAEHLLASPSGARRRTDRIRLMGWPAPILVFFYTLTVKGCILDGLAGWHYVLQRLFAETLIALELADRRLAAAPGSPQNMRSVT